MEDKDEDESQGKQRRFSLDSVSQS